MKFILQMLLQIFILPLDFVLLFFIIKRWRLKERMHARFIMAIVCLCCLLFGTFLGNLIVTALSLLFHLHL